MAAENRNKSVRASFIIKFANLNTLIVIFAVVARTKGSYFLIFASFSNIKLLQNNTLFKHRPAMQDVKTDTII